MRAESSPTYSVVAVVFWLALTTSTAVVAALKGHEKLRPWSVPPVTKHEQHRHRDFLDHQCESLARVLERLRGGGGSSSGYNPDEWTDTTPTTPTGRQNNYLEEDYHADDSYAAARRRPEIDRRYGGTNSRSEEDYDDYGRGPPPRGRSSSGTSSVVLPKIIQQGDRKIGLLLLATGLSTTILGIALFMNSTLLRLGNLLLIAGVPMTLGPTRTIGYFVKPEKMRSTVCLALGILLVFAGHPIFGIVLEVFGLLNLFGNMFPILMVFAKQMPVIGPLLKSLTSPSKQSARARNGSGRDDDYYYDDYGGGRASNDEQRSRAPQQHYYDDDYRDSEGSSSASYQ
jgi:hypothetical protein